MGLFDTIKTVTSLVNPAAGLAIKAGEVFAQHPRAVHNALRDASPGLRIAEDVVKVGIDHPRQVTRAVSGAAKVGSYAVAPWLLPYRLSGEIGRYAAAHPAGVRSAVKGGVRVGLDVTVPGLGIVRAARQHPQAAKAAARGAVDGASFLMPFNPMLGVAKYFLK